MLLDFEFLLVLVTFVTGLIWGWDKWRRRGKKAEGEQKVSWWVDLSRSLFPVILAVLVIRSFVVEPFRIPSGSMVPTLLAGDFILVNKFAFGLRLPVLHTRILGDGKPERGDVVVFRYPVDPSQDYIKRVIGLPGDHIRYVHKKLYINGKPMDQKEIGHYPPAPRAVLTQEDLSGVDHRILLYGSAPDRGFSYTVPPNSYFMMGDNRDRSSDSRFWGPVPAANLVGRAFLIWMSWDFKDYGINWGRIGQAID
ncbi:MAG: signal peptidase I [Ectothiorhodospiraceae bacterium]|jgi:signal peptidase I